MAWAFWWAPGEEVAFRAYNSGAAHVFERDADWQVTRRVQAPSTRIDDRFGISVSLDASRILVGANGDDGPGDDGGIDSGAAFLFVGDLSDPIYLRAFRSDRFDAYGGAVALEGANFVVGARREASAARDVDGNAADNALRDSGAAYIGRIF